MENTEQILEEAVKKAELSKEELQERRDKITEYYNDHIPHLEVQLKYESLLTDIEENRAKRAQAQKFLAQIMAPEDNPQ